MNVTTENQTLLLASERRMNGDGSSPLDKALSAASSGGTLKRLTIVAAQPDTSLVVVRADYATDSITAAASVPPVVTRQSGISNTARSNYGDYLPRGGGPYSRDAYGNPYRGSGSSSAHLQPTEQYARTQRLSMAPVLASHVDLLA